jgi:carboxypeptidase Q
MAQAPSVTRDPFVERQMKTTRSATVAFGVAIAAVRFQAGAFGQQPAVDQKMIAAIKAEALRPSEATKLFHTLTDTFGPRLTGSPAHVQAARWAVERFREWGLNDPHLEPFEFGSGWSLEKITAEMVAPRYMPLIGYAEAWSTSTSGVISGTPIYVGDSTTADIDKLGARLRGAIVLTSRPQTEFLGADRMQPTESNGPVQTGNPPVPGRSSTAPIDQILARVRALGAGVVLSPGPTEHGTVRVQGNRNTSRDAVPSVVLAAEQYNMLVRMVQAGAPLHLRIEVGTRFYDDDRNSYNVLADIPGTDPALRDQVVLVSAHLDSWHTATGATDNADGVTAVMEAVRILSALGARPRRTIRVALWSGEEQGLLGARAYVDHHLRDEAARRRVAVMINDDPGTGPTYGFYMQANEAAKRIFDAWLEPLRDLGVRRNVIEGIGSTDHVPFDEIGIPAFTVIKDFHNYDTRTRHTNADMPDSVKIEDLRQSAVVLATVVWHASMRDEPIPHRRP